MGTGLASFVLLLFLLRSPWENATRASEVCDRQGQRRDCDLYDAPASKDRVCWMHNRTRSGNTGLEWYTGTLDSERCSNFGKTISRSVSKFCPGYVGMNMSLWCDFINVSSVIYKDGVPLGEGPTVTFDGLQKENEGLYQCRKRGSLELIDEFNMTVQSEVHIGGANIQECVPFNCDLSPITDRKCCYYHISRNNYYNSLQLMGLSVYGDAPINLNLAVEWITSSTDHYPTDLGPYINRSSTNPIGWELNFRHFPDNVNDQALLAAIVVTATNNISSFSVCIAISFASTGIYNANTSLPQETNTTVGGNATFICEFGSNQPNEIIAPLLSFEISLASEDGNSTTFTTNCRQWKNCNNWSPELVTTQLSIRPIILTSKSNFINYRYEVLLTNVVEEFNASQFSCSIRTGSPERILQWKGTAELIVEPAPVGSQSSTPTVLPGSGDNDNNVTVPRVSSTSNRSAITAAAVVLVMIILALVAAISLLLATFTKWRRKHREESYELSQVPLTTLSHSTVVSPSPTNPDDEPFTSDTTTTEQCRLPAISIMDVGGVHRNINVGREMLHETRSTDSGVSCTEDYEHNVRRLPNALGMTRAQQLKILENRAPVRLCRSETDIADSPSVAAGMHTPQKKSVIYISYTDHASQWVRSTLKPMIDSWDVADVMLPERDMVAGKAISNERRRLIVEADKIIVVVSPDYYNSEWCSYELMHAIQNEPTLSRGRIIPILIDGCKLLPKNMEVVVPLFAHEQDFSQRLLAAIYPQPTPRLSLQ